MAGNAATGVGRGDGGEIETQRLRSGRKRTEPRGLALNLIEEGVSLRFEMGVALGHGAFVPGPFGFPELKDAPALLAVFDFYRIQGRVKLQGVFGRSLNCLLYTSPTPRNRTRTRLPSPACNTKL